MNHKKIDKQTQQNYLNLLDALGEESIYRRIVGAAINSSVDIENPEIGLLDTSDSFLYLFRQTGEDKFFLLSKIMRRAAHVVYRELCRQDKEKKINFRFLNAV